MIGFIYEDSKKSSSSYEIFLSSIFCFLTAEMLGIMFLIYAMFGLIGYNFFAWIFGTFSQYSLLMFGGLMSILFWLFLIGVFCGNSQRYPMKGWSDESNEKASDERTSYERMSDERTSDERISDERMSYEESRNREIKRWLSREEKAWITLGWIWECLGFIFEVI